MCTLNFQDAGQDFSHNEPQQGLHIQQAEMSSERLEDSLGNARGSFVYTIQFV